MIHQSNLKDGKPYTQWLEEAFDFLIQREWNGRRANITEGDLWDYVRPKDNSAVRERMLEVENLTFVLNKYKSQWIVSVIPEAEDGPIYSPTFYCFQKQPHLCR